jgi:type IV secretion system protein TrbL
MWLLRTLVALELVIVALWWALTQEEALVAFLPKVLWISAFIYVVTQWSTLTKAVVDSFILTGLRAGGGGLTPRDFTDPSTIAAYGLQVTAVIFARIASFSGLGAIKNLPEIFLAGLSALGIVLAFFVMAIQVFITLLEFYLVSALALVLVPFGVYRHTAFLAERAFGMILAFGIKLMVLACITSAMLPVLVTLNLPADPSFKDILSLLLASLALAMLTWHAPSIAAGMMAGAPSLTASTAAHTALAAGATVGLAAVGVAAGVRGTVTAGRGLLAGGRGMLTAGSAVATAAQQGGLQGLGQLTRGAASDVWTWSTARVTQGFREAIASGRIYASQHVAPRALPPGPGNPPTGGGGGLGRPPPGPRGSGPPDPGPGSLEAGRPHPNSARHPAGVPAWARRLARGSTLAARVVPPSSPPQGGHQARLEP